MRETVTVRLSPSRLAVPLPLDAGEASTMSTQDHHGESGAFAQTCRIHIRCTVAMHTHETMQPDNRRRGESDVPVRHTVRTARAPTVLRLRTITPAATQDQSIMQAHCLSSNTRKCLRPEMFNYLSYPSSLLYFSFRAPFQLHSQT